MYILYTVYVDTYIDISWYLTVSKEGLQNYKLWTMAKMSEIIIKVLSCSQNVVYLELPPESCFQTHSTPAARRSHGRDNGPVATWPLWPLASVVTRHCPRPQVFSIGARVCATCRILPEFWWSCNYVETVSSRPPDSRQRTPHLHTALLGRLATWQTCNDTFEWKTNMETTEIFFCGSV